jgi:NAD(P)-dependent dehydrogenase (short-subunit alcohol dehydrogenase family)
MAGLTTLKGKVAVITGGASGIGKSIAKRMLAAGMKVVIADIDPASLKATADELGVLGVPTDVRRYDAVKTLAKAAVEVHGTVHVICNNAGIGPFARMDALTLEDWKWMIDVNLWGVIHGVQAFLPILQANKDGGHVVNTASTAGMIAGPRAGAYITTKFAVVGLTETLASEMALDGGKVGVSILLPGPVRTNIAANSRNRPTDVGEGKLRGIELEEAFADDLFGDQSIPYISPDEVGALVVRGIQEKDLWIFTHPDPPMFSMITDRQDQIAAAAAAQRARRAAVRQKERA